jgi:hypothetical protein
MVLYSKLVLDIWRQLLSHSLPGTDYSALRASPLRGRPSGVIRDAGLETDGRRPCGAAHVGWEVHPLQYFI